MLDKRLNKEETFKELVESASIQGKIDPEHYQKYNVKRGLRNEDGTGVLVGLTEVGEVFSYIMDDGEQVPAEGRLFYRGIEIKDLVNGFYQEQRYGFEECVYLLLIQRTSDQGPTGEFHRTAGQLRASCPTISSKT